LIFFQVRRRSPKGGPCRHESGGRELDEKDLTKKQRRWLEASRKIGRGAITKSEREVLEQLYAEMLPAEQQELAAYIREKFEKKEPAEQSSGLVKHEEGARREEDPTEHMERRVWAEPSEALRSALSRSIVPKKRLSENRS